MSHWNYRVVKERYNDEDWYTIREVYYDDDGKIRGYTDEIAPGGETVEVLRATLKLMRSCTDKPILDEDELKKMLKAP